MRIRAATSTLLLIDIQTRLFPALEDGDALLVHSHWLLQIAQRLQVPSLLTEQYSKGLGPTLPILREAHAAERIVEKLHFSAVTEGELLQRSGGEREQFVVCGAEAHVCVLQTVLDLLALGRRVFVVVEAVASRQASDKALALTRMQQAGAVLVSREMVAFEWLDKAGDERFREISQGFLR